MHAVCVFPLAEPVYTGDVTATPTPPATAIARTGPVETPALEPEQCAVARCAELVTGKWTLLLVRDLASGPRYFSELQESLAGISPRTLCDRLKLLAAEGCILRTRIKGLPPRTMYELTERGHALVPIVETMRAVGEAMLLDPYADADELSELDADGPCIELG